jgi:hypothetical protein
MFFQNLKTKITNKYPLLPGLIYVSGILITYTYHYKKSSNELYSRNLTKSDFVFFNILSHPIQSILWPFSTLINCGAYLLNNQADKIIEKKRYDEDLLYELAKQKPKQ